jgi:gliding motility-associated-like protein
MIGRVIFLLTSICIWQFASAQEAYNNCNNAFELCPNNNYSFNNIDANATVCPGCEDDFNYCFDTDNSIWMTFTTNATGGDIQVDLTNLVFQNDPGQDNELQATIIEAAAPCDATTYTQIGNCVSNATGNFSLNAVGLPANTTYYVVVDGDNNGVGITDPAEASFDLTISGTGIDRPVPTAFVGTLTPSSCLNDIVTYEAILQNCPDSTDYQWFINGDLAATTTDPFFSTTALQDGDIVSVQNTCFTQCVDTVTGTAAQPQSVYTIFVDAGNDLTINDGESIQLFGSTSATVYYWTPTFLLNSSTVLNPIANPTETTTFTLTAEENGCTLSDQVTITVSSDLVIPNTFSPNEDGNNDTWEIRGIDAYPSNTVKIYNRWGQIVFSAVSYSSLKAWDGTIRSGKAAEGVYYYVIDLGDGSDIKNGSLTLLR